MSEADATETDISSDNAIDEDDDDDDFGVIEDSSSPQIILKELAAPSHLVSITLTSPKTPSLADTIQEYSGAGGHNDHKAFLPQARELLSISRSDIATTYGEPFGTSDRNCLVDNITRIESSDRLLDGVSKAGGSQQEQSESTYT